VKASSAPSRGASLRDAVGDRAVWKASRSRGCGGPGRNPMGQSSVTVGVEVYRNNASARPCRRPGSFARPLSAGPFALRATSRRWRPSPRRQKVLRVGLSSAAETNFGPGVFTSDLLLEQASCTRSSRRAPHLRLLARPREGTSPRRRSRCRR
jgi:hypothetical protein